ncbi:MAG TPA: carboxypeptidase regulatory-like domain-containing protein [Gemmatimonadales bacterium]|nr:carboxypeptidase regulatory-like domain-containing protein [Gemmatimonadales bacterium]
MTTRAAFVVALALTVPRATAAQVGATTDIITGTVTGPDSQPLAGAIVVATSLETRVSRQRTTDVRGHYTIVFPDGGGRYELTARFIGMAPAQVTVVRQADEDRIEATIRMGVLAVPLEPVTVSARSSARSDGVGPGSTGRSYNPEQLARLPIDASDLNTIATLQPGVLGIRASDSTATAFSVAGQRPTANNVTLDGLSFGTASVPQDAVRSIRVVTNAYDVARGQYSGGLVTSTTRLGTNVPQGSFTYALRDRDLAWGEATTSPFGQGATQNQLGGGIGGPIVPNKLFAFAALQGRWRDQALPSLASADPGTLVRLGVSPDSAARFVALASAAGVPVTLSNQYDERATNNTLGLLRLDWQASDAHTLMLRLDGSWESQEPTRVGTLALPATGGTRTASGGGVMASLTSYFGGRFINELRGYVARQRRDTRPFLALPNALVVVTSDLPNSGQGVAALAFGGNGGLPQHTDNRSLEIADEFSWLPGLTAHRLKVGVDVIGTRLEESQTPNQFGTFIYPSLAALAADSPATFTRTLVPVAQPGTAWNSAVYAGDTWRPGAGGGLQLTYGVRLETTRFSGAPQYNRAVDSLFGVRTDRIPSEVHVSPRLGFTWALGDGSDGPQTTFLRGGAGDFRSLTPTSLYAAALGAPGLASAETQLTCVGSAVPRPDWSRYAQDPSTIPSACTDTTAAVTVAPRPDVTAFAPGFGAPRARRASLALVRRFGRSNYWVTLEGSYARGVSQYGFRDLNLVTTPRFALPAEAGRPVYVPADSIVPATGAVSSSASRLHPEFGNVLLVGSDLESDTKQLTLTITGATSGGAAFRLGYTLTRARDQSSFSCCAASSGFAAPSTGGDPNAREWSRSSLERRHAFVGIVTVPITRALEIGAVGTFISGVPFTPIVGSDINGDGAKNDRAFVFNPGVTADPTVANGMSALLATAPSSIRGCLQGQLGRIAARNSCTGPWQPSLDLQLNWRPQWFGSDRRLTVSLLTVNLLGGLDEWLHGAANLRGWGYASAPDPVLLYVQGFDPATSQFRYAVNGRFGATASASGGVSVPFQVALQGRLSVGPGRIRRTLRDARPPALDRPAPPPATNPIALILGLRDTLGCTPDQVAELQRIADSLDARSRVLPEGLDASLTLAAARDNARWALERARAVLTAEQWSRLPGALKSPEPALND